MELPYHGRVDPTVRTSANHHVGDRSLWSPSFISSDTKEAMEEDRKVNSFNAHVSAVLANPVVVVGGKSVTLSPSIASIWIFFRWLCATWLWRRTVMVLVRWVLRSKLINTILLMVSGLILIGALYGLGWLIILVIVALAYKAAPDSGG
jgi:hypothetical protein